MALGLNLIAKPRPVGMLGKLRGGSKNLLGEVANWLAQNCLPKPLSIQSGTDAIVAQLVHGEEPLRIQGGAETLLFSAQTTAAGPGYHEWLCEVLDRLGKDLQLDWQPETEEYFDETGYFFSRDKQALRREMEEWLKTMMEICAGKDSGQMRLTMPLDEVFASDLPLQTQLGPHDHTWAQGMVEDLDPASFWYWNSSGTGAEYKVGLARLLMWMNVRWRRPVTDTEHSLLVEIDRLLTEARRETPTIELPVREWDEIRGFLGREPVGLQSPTTADRIGYRRRPFRSFPSRHWSVELDGGLATGWEDGNYRAFDEKHWVGMSFYSLDPGKEPPKLPSDGEPIVHPNSNIRSRMSLSFTEENGWLLKGSLDREGKLMVFTVVSPERDWLIRTFESVNFES